MAGCLAHFLHHMFHGGSPNAEMKWTSSRWWSWELMYHGNPSRYQTEIHDQFSNPRRLIRLRALSEKQDMRLRRQLRELRSLGIRVAVCCLMTWSLRYLEVIDLGPKMNRHCVARHYHDSIRKLHVRCSHVTVSGLDLGNHGSSSSEYSAARGSIWGPVACPWT